MSAPRRVPASLASIRAKWNRSTLRPASARMSSAVTPGVLPTTRRGGPGGSVVSVGVGAVPGPVRRRPSPRTLPRATSLVPRRPCRHRRNHPTAPGRRPRPVASRSGCLARGRSGDGASASVSGAAAAGSEAFGAGRRRRRVRRGRRGFARRPATSGRVPAAASARSSLEPVSGARSGSAARTPAARRGRRHDRGAARASSSTNRSTTRPAATTATSSSESSTSAVSSASVRVRRSWRTVTSSISGASPACSRTSARAGDAGQACGSSETPAGPSSSSRR